MQSAQGRRRAALLVMCTTLLATFSLHAATAGPGTWSSQQTWAADTVNGGNLTGYFYWPASQPTTPNGKRALVLVLHGCQQTASGDVINGASGGGFNWKSNGSNQSMGLNNLFYTTTLAETATGYYVVGNCP
ncbi:poly(3-hydroxybutyrate) depolymerase [Cupriavidus alkaliphilus]|nr:poly(3-hydroxybutyrate) depolymerase [Cupriavidus alkaliphilus]